MVDHVVNPRLGFRRDNEDQDNQILNTNGSMIEDENEILQPLVSERNFIVRDQLGF